MRSPEIYRAHPPGTRDSRLRTLVLSAMHGGIIWKWTSRALPQVRWRQIGLEAWGTGAPEFPIQVVRTWLEGLPKTGKNRGHLSSCLCRVFSCRGARAPGLHAEELSFHGVLHPCPGRAGLRGVGGSPGGLPGRSEAFASWEAPEHCPPRILPWGMGACGAHGHVQSI